MPTTDILEAPRAYLFQCKNDSGLFAVSLERNADNIPFGTAWYGGWRLRSEFALDVDGRAPTEMDPKPILRGVRSVGYYIWRNGLV
jgi:hypothetical protein